MFPKASTSHQNRNRPKQGMQLNYCSSLEDKYITSIDFRRTAAKTKPFIKDVDDHLKDVKFFLRDINDGTRKSIHTNNFEG